MRWWWWLRFFAAGWKRAGKKHGILLWAAVNKEGGNVWGAQPLHIVIIRSAERETSQSITRWITVPVPPIRGLEVLGGGLRGLGHAEQVARCLSSGSWADANSASRNSSLQRTALIFDITTVYESYVHGRHVQSSKGRVFRAL